jgi:hypothetical protein
MLHEGWDLAVVLTELPMTIGRRPVVADASATHGVAVLSLPALGAVHVGRRTQDAIVRLVDGLVGESMDQPRSDGATDGKGRRHRVGGRLGELAAPLRRRRGRGDDGGVRFAAGVVRGHVRLLAGMVHANRPWRLASQLSRALAAALGTVALALANSSIWQLSDQIGAARLAVMTVLSILALVAWLIVDHELWERPKSSALRRQAVLFNTATTITVVLGVALLYVALFGVTLLATLFVIEGKVLGRAIQHHAATGSFIRLAWMATSVGVVGGALGSGLESDDAVKQAAYGYRPDRDADDGRSDGVASAPDQQR